MRLLNLTDIIDDLKRRYNMATGKRYWYQVKFIYRTKRSGTILFNFYDQIGLSERKSILKSRIIKTAIVPLHKQNRTKGHLSNGVLEIEPMAYLGHFKQ